MTYEYGRWYSGKNVDSGTVFMIFPTGIAIHTRNSTGSSSVYVPMNGSDIVTFIKEAINVTQ